MKRSKHTLSNYKLLTCDMGKLIPVGLQEALPGDTWQMATSALIRCSPLAAPVMHPVSVRFHHFFVPHRLVWDESGNTSFEDFITGGSDGNDSQTVPTQVVTSPSGTLFEYLGIPDNLGGAKNVNALPLRGINTIWNEFYRDQDIASVRGINSSSIPDIAWEKDYFTSARPWTQKGDDVTLPTGSQAAVKGIGVLDSASTTSSKTVHETDTSPDPTWTNPYRAYDGVSSNIFIEADGANGDPQIYADLANATAINVNDFRRAFALQRYKEARARYGSRYTEYLRYLGVNPSDARLQRPEYLGGGKTMISFSEVLQSSDPGSTSGNGYGVGDMYGHGIAATRTRPVRRFIEEHGYIHTLMSVRPRTMYYKGIPRTFLRQTKEDFFQKELEFIGQQEVYDDEVYGLSTNTTADVFGYQDRYEEYRHTPSTVAGDFRDTLEYWHLGRDFSSAPSLNETFIKCDPSKRIHNVQTEDALWCMINNHAVARRLVKKSAYARIL